ncbi:MAG: hypothetical protein IKP10_05660 [Clostridia bacterium]|nr:hypothetical protein [Clostridia bacterium]
MTDKGALIEVTAVSPSETELTVSRMAGMLETMAALIRTTNERMAELETQVRRLEKVTPAQAAALNAKIRERAQAVCREYRAQGQEKPAAAAIRRSVRLYTGARTAREISRCDYSPTADLIDGWDDYQEMKKIRRAGK